MKSKFTLLLLFIQVFILSIKLQAATGAWNNAAGGNWGTTTNWTPSTIPNGILQQAFFTNNLGAGPIAVNLEAGRTINRMTFSGNSAYSFSGSTITLSGLNREILNNSSAQITFNNNLSLGLLLPIVFDGTGTTTVNGALVGGLTGVIKNGSGTVILNGTNTFGGPLTIIAGMVQTTTFGIPNDVLLGGGHLLIQQAFDGSMSNNITGNGSFTKAGAGTVTLTGSKTFTGQITNNGGTIRISANNNLGNATNAVVMNNGSTLQTTTNFVSGRNFTMGGGGGGVFRTDTGSTLTISGVISGAGALTKSGTGTLNLGGTNTFTGSVAINGGTLNANGGRAIGDTSAVTVGSGATLGLGANETIGSLAGAGNVTLGGNTLSAGGDNTSTTFSGVMSGTGGYTKNGTGTNTLTGVNTYTGTTTVNAGALVLNGSVAGDLTVNASGFLGGSGTIGGNLINNGFINPGNSPGTLNITGNFIQGAGGTLMMELNGVNPGQFDQLNITGSATLNGTLQLVTSGVVTLEDGDNLPIILAAGGINGQFANVLGSAALSADLIYTATQVTVGIRAISYTNNPVLNPNQLAIATVLQQVRYNNNADWVNSVRPVLNGLSQQQIAAAFDQMSPVFYQSMPQAQMGWMQNQFQNIRGRFDELHFGNQNGISTRNLALFDSRGERLLAGSGSMVATDLGSPLYAPKASEWDKNLGMFISGSGQFGNMDATSALNGYDFQTAGLTLGMDYQINENLVAGVFGGYASTWTQQDANNGKSDADTGQGGIYATYFRKNTFLNVVAGGGYTSYDTERPIVFGSLNRTATANPNGAQAFTMIEGGHDFQVGKLRLGPVAGFQYRYANVNQFTEQGAGALNLTVNERDLQSIMSQAGVRLSYEFKLGKVLIVPSASARWQHEFANTDEAMLARFGTINSGTFSVSTVGPGENSALVNIGLNTYLTETISIFAAYNLETDTADYTVNGVNGGFSWRF